MVYRLQRMMRQLPVSPFLVWGSQVVGALQTLSMEVSITSILWLVISYQNPKKYSLECQVTCIRAEQPPPLTHVCHYSSSFFYLFFLFLLPYCSIPVFCISKQAVLHASPRICISYRCGIMGRYYGWYHGLGMVSWLLSWLLSKCIPRQTPRNSGVGAGKLFTALE